MGLDVAPCAGRRSRAQRRTARAHDRARQGRRVLARPARARVGHRRRDHVRVDDGRVACDRRPTAPAPAAPVVTVTQQRPHARCACTSPARRSRSGSCSASRRARAGRRTSSHGAGLGPSQLVDGYANGWLVDAARVGHVRRSCSSGHRNARCGPRSGSRCWPGCFASRSSRRRGGAGAGRVVGRSPRHSPAMPTSISGGSVATRVRQSNPAAVRGASRRSSPALLGGARRRPVGRRGRLAVLRRFRLWRPRAGGTSSPSRPRCSRCARSTSSSSSTAINYPSVFEWPTVVPAGADPGLDRRRPAGGRRDRGNLRTRRPSPLLTKANGYRCRPSHIACAPGPRARSRGRWAVHAH